MEALICTDHRVGLTGMWPAYIIDVTPLSVGLNFDSAIILQDKQISDFYDFVETYQGNIHVGDD